MIDNKNGFAYAKPLFIYHVFKKLLEEFAIISLSRFYDAASRYAIMRAPLAPFILPVLFIRCFRENIFREGIVLQNLAKYKIVCRKGHLE